MNGGYGSGISSSCTGMEAAWSDLTPNWTTMEAMGAGCYGNSVGGSNCGEVGDRWDPAIGCCLGDGNDALTWNSSADGWSVDQPYTQPMMQMGSILGEGGVGSIGCSYGDASSIGGGWGCIGGVGNDGPQLPGFIGGVSGGGGGGIGGNDADSDFGTESDNSDPDDPVDFDIDGLFPRSTTTSAGDSAAGGPMMSHGAGGMGCDGADCRDSTWLCEQPQEGQFSFL